MTSGPPADDSELDGIVSAEAAKKIREKRQQKEASDEYPVLPENWTAVCLFLDSADQLNISPAGQIIGLKSEAVDVEIRRGGYEPLAVEDWQRFKIVSRVAINLLNKSSD